MKTETTHVKVRLSNSQRDKLGELISKQINDLDKKLSQCPATNVGRHAMLEGWKREIENIEQALWFPTEIQ